MAPKTNFQLNAFHFYARMKTAYENHKKSQEFNFTSFFHASNSNFDQSHRQIKPMLAREKKTKNRPKTFVFW